MFGWGKSTPVEEYQARGDIEWVYHEIRQVLRVSGVNLNFRTWAGYGGFLPALWEAQRPNVETLAFEASADRLRAEAVHAAAALPWPERGGGLKLGQSQRYQIQAALALYHYINPKLLLFTAAAHLALAGEVVGGQTQETTRLPRGVPATMYPMEMVAAEPDELMLRALFKDIQQTLALSAVNSDYRTLALWPDYLSAAWRRLKPVVQREDYRHASNRLREAACAQARALPHPLNFSRQTVMALGQDADEIIEVTARFMGLLPSVIINIALLGLDWQEAETLAASPFPVPLGENP